MPRPKIGQERPDGGGKLGPATRKSGGNPGKRRSTDAASFFGGCDQEGRGGVRNATEGQGEPLAVPSEGHFPGGAGQGPVSAPLESPVFGREPLILINRAKVCAQDALLEPKTVAERVAKFVDLKVYSLGLSDWEVAANPGDSLAQKWGQDKCGDWLSFRRWSGGGEESRIVAANFCGRHLTCPLCANRRGARLLQELVPKLVQVRQENEGSKLHLVTLTLTNGPDLSERLGKLRSGVQLMQQRRRTANRDGHRTAMGGVLGGVGQVEIKRGSASGLWHPHYHGIWLNDGPMDYRALLDAWRDVLGEGWAGGNVRKLDCETRPFASEENFREQLAKDTCEVCKYTVKFDSSTSAEDCWNVATQVQGKRLRSSFGVLRGLDVDPELLDEQLDWNMLDWWDTFYRWSHRGQDYKQDFSRVSQRDGKTGVHYTRSWLAGQSMERHTIQGENGERIAVNWDYMRNVAHELEAVPF